MLLFLLLFTSFSSVDFGLAKLAREGKGWGFFQGTKLWAAPEKLVSMQGNVHWCSSYLGDFFFSIFHISFPSISHIQ
jgi:hypothetical protein